MQRNSSLLPRRRTLTLPAFGVAVGLVAGIVDWTTILNDWGRARSGMFYLPALTWIFVICSWIAFCCLTSIVFSSERLGRFRPSIVVAAAGGVLLLVRVATPLREATALSTGRVLMACFATTVLISLPFGAVRLRPTRFMAAWLGGTLIAICVLVLSAADLPLPAARPADARENTRTNVAIVFLDTVRYDDALGPNSVMPHLAQLASHSTTFDDAWAPVPWTVPSHFAVLTGRDPWTLPVSDSPGFHYSGPTLAQKFRSAGYDTAAVLANPLMGSPDFSVGFQTFTYSRKSGVCRSGIGELLSRSWLHDGPRMPVCSWLIASEVTARAVAIVQRARRPFFLVVNYMDGHDPYYVPDDCRAPSFSLMPRAERESFLRSSATRPATSEVLQRAHSQYRRAIACMDRSLDALVTELQRDRNTIVVVLGDHGEQFGEHGLVTHGNSVYRQVLHVPVVISGPGLQSVHVSGPVSITDLYASVLRAAFRTQSDALLPIADERVRRDVVANYEAVVGTTTEAGFSVSRGGYQYILWRDGQEVLYDYQRDPAETRPIQLSLGSDVMKGMKAIALRAIRAQRRTNDFNALGYLR